MPLMKKRRAGGEDVELEDAAGAPTPVPKRRRKGPHYNQDEICQEIFDVIRNHKTEDGRLLCETFLRIPKRRTDPEYYNLIEKPIDLMKVQSKLKNEEYEDIDEMTDDIGLIVANAKKFYSGISQEYKDASNLLDLYEDSKTKILATKFSDEPMAAVDEESSDTKVMSTSEENSRDVNQQLQEEDTNDIEELEEEDDGEETDQMEIPDDTKEGEEEEGGEDTVATPKRRRGRPPRREVIAEKGEDDKPKTYHVKKRSKEAADFRSIIFARGRGRPPKDDSGSRDGRETDDVESSVGEDEGGPYEELLTAVTYAKDGDRPISDIFKVLPNKKNLPDYYDVIKEPMDLKTVAQKIQRNEYTSIEEMSKDLHLMISNAKLYNEPGSQVYRDAGHLRRLINKEAELCQARTPSGTRLNRGRLRRDHQEKVSAVLARLDYPPPGVQQLNEVPQTQTVDTGEEEASETEGSVADEADSPFWMLYSAVKNYTTPTGEVLSEPFLRLPNRRMYPDYYEEIEKPIALLKIRTRIKTGKYKKIEKLYTELHRVFDNAKIYNVNKSQIHKDAVKLLDVLNGKYREVLTMPKPELFEPIHVQTEPFLINAQHQFNTNFHPGPCSPPPPQPLEDFIQSLDPSFLDIVPTPVPLEVILQDEIWNDSTEIMMKKSRRSYDTASVTSEEGGGGTPKRKPGRRPGSHSTEDTLKRRLWTLYKTVSDLQIDGRTLIDIFVTLPARKDYPDYYQVISDPIDMTMIETKIKENKYCSDQVLVQDLELMFNNARHYNEEKSQIYKDAETLERILRSKVKSLPPLEGSPLFIGKASRKTPSCNPQLQRFHDLYNYVKDYSDPRGRILSTPFIKLPPKQDYPDYYDVIKKPIDMMRISQRLSSTQYGSLEDMVADFVQIFDNACKYNEPDSLIYKDALTLQRVCLEKKQELMSEDDMGGGVPDLRAMVQEMLTKLFIATYNHTDEEGRCYSDSFQELPALIEEDSTSPAPADSQISKPRKRPSFEQVKRNLDRGRYRRMDRFQEDIFEVFQHARRVSRTDSQLYEDAVELQLFFIKLRDEICRNGEHFITPALSYTEHMINLAVDQEKKLKQSKEQKEDEERRRREQSRDKDDTDRTEADPAKDEGEDSFVYNGHTYHIGDFVHIEPREAGLSSHIVLIEKLWKDQKGEPWFKGNFFLQPQETYHLANRKFLQKEVFKSDKYENVHFSKITGHCNVMSVKDYFKLKPEGIPESDVFVCESRYHSRLRSFKKIKIWNNPKNENTKLVLREVPLVPVRVASVFVEKNDTSDSETEECSVLDREREVVTDDSMNSGEDGNTYYQQLHVEAGWFKLGDFAFVQQMGVKTVITRIDRMWTNSAGDAFIYGPTYVHPSDTEHQPTRTFYEKEVFKTPYEDTHWMDNILGRCVAMPHKDYVSCRLTEVAEKDVFICEAKYIENEKLIKKFMKPTSMINPSSLSIRVCDDEVYYFKKPIVPLKFPSPQLLELPQQSFSMDESAMTGFEEASSQLDTSYTDNFNLSVGFGGLDLPAPTSTPTPNSTVVPELEQPKSNKKKGARRTKAEKLADAALKASKKKGKASGYIMFAAEYRKDIMNQHKDLSFGEISKIVGQKLHGAIKQKWKSLEKEQKEVYEALAKKQQAAMRAKQEEAQRLLNESLKQQQLQQTASPLRDSQSPQQTNTQTFSQNSNSNQSFAQTFGSSPYQQGSQQLAPLQYQQPQPVQPLAPGGKQQPVMGPLLPLPARGGPHTGQGLQNRVLPPPTHPGAPPNIPVVFPHSQPRTPAPTPPVPPHAMQQQPSSSQQTTSQAVSGQQQMGPPPPPPRPSSPMFVTVPPRTQRLLHSEAYLKYIENLHPDRQDVSNWRRQLMATQENTTLSQGSKLPAHWLAPTTADHHQSTVTALWALRDLMMKDTLSIARTLDYNEL